MFVVTLESMFFSSNDIEQGRNKPPFRIQDIVELPVSSWSAVCAGSVSTDNRCVVVADLRTNSSAVQQLGKLTTVFIHTQAHTDHAQHHATSAGVSTVV